MATWSDASTDEYWSSSGGWTYVGAGVWEAGGGPGATLNEYYATPLAGDPYTYEGAATTYGTKFKISLIASGSVRTAYARIYTNQGNYYPANYLDIPYVFDVGENTIYEVTITYTPSGTERPTSIIISSDWGQYYGSDPLLYDIKVDLTGGVDEPTYCCRLVKTDGRTEVTIPDPPNNPPVRVIPPPEIPGGRIPTPGGGGGGGSIGNKPLEWGSEPISPPNPVGFTPWGGGNCNTCTITLLDLEQSGTSGIVIPQGCCQTIIIVE